MTESSLGLSGAMTEWSYVAKLRDRLIVDRAGGSGNGEFSYVYYMRPKYRGEYMIPPVTAYFLHDPSIHAVGDYLRITVQ